MTKIGVQAMMLKDSVAEIGAFETLRKVSEIGYHAVEISQIPMTPENVAELDRSRTELGMDIAALSVMLQVPEGMPGDSLEKDFDKIVQDAKQLDTQLLRIGMLPLTALTSVDAVIDFAKQANDYATRLREQGIDLYYHNHHVEFAKSGGKYLLDVIADNSPAMGLELDVHWVQRGGLDPVRTIDKYAGRTAMVHLKDYRIGRCRRRPSNCCTRATSRHSWSSSRTSCSSPRSAKATWTSHRSSSTRNRPARNTCWSSRTNCTVAPSGRPCKPRTTICSRWAPRDLF